VGPDEDVTGAELVPAGLTSTPSNSPWGPIIAAEVLLSLGLSLITAPATEAVMGSLRADQLGSGAAVNNTTRELGGTLGVAVFGSTFASAYAPRITSSFSALRVPDAATHVASQSMAAALEVVPRAPASLQPTLAGAATSAFQSGFRLACLVCSVVTVLGALAAARFLSGRGELLAA
jgi:hypothetical protein